MTRFSSRPMVAGGFAVCSLIAPPGGLVEVDLPLQVEPVVAVRRVFDLHAAVEELQVRVVPERPPGDAGDVARLGRAGRREPVPLGAEDRAPLEPGERVPRLAHDRRLLGQIYERPAAGVPLREVDLPGDHARTD